MKFIRWIGDFFKKLGDDHVSEYTAECAYYTFLSFIPFIILLLSLIKYVNIDKDTLAYIFEAILPNVMKNSVLDIIQEVYSKSFEAVSISAIFMLWSASRSFFVLNKGLSHIYNKEEENYIWLVFKGIIWAILALILLIVILVILVFGNTIEQSIRENFSSYNGLLNLILAARSMISIGILFFIFLILYRFTPKTEEKRIVHCIPGAAFTASSWYAISFFFSIYVNIFTNFSIIYGSLATIIIIMMWLYSVIYAIFLGAEINSIIQDKINFIFIKLKKNKIKMKFLKDKF